MTEIGSFSARPWYSLPSKKGVCENRQSIDRLASRWRNQGTSCHQYQYDGQEEGNTRRECTRTFRRAACGLLGNVNARRERGVVVLQRKLDRFVSLVEVGLFRNEALDDVH